MKPVALTVLAVALACLSSHGQAQSANDADCRSGILPALAAGNFSGSLDCRRDDLKISKVGEIIADRHVFQIYDYRYRLAPACPECAIHGGQRIIIMNSGRYIGQYKPYGAHVAVEKTSLILSPSAKSDHRTAVNFAPIGPPRRIWFDGEELILFR